MKYGENSLSVVLKAKGRPEMIPAAKINFI